MRKITKKQDKDFRTAVTISVLCYNAKPINEDIRNGNYHISGKLNGLEIFVDCNIGSEVYSVFCRYDSPCKGSNNISGKVNFHRVSEYSSDWAARDFEIFLKGCCVYLN